MDIDVVAPELREGMQRQPSLDLSRRMARIAGRLGPRLMRWPRTPGVVIGRERLGGVRVRTYDPPEPRTDAQLLWIHGGGMVVGAPPMDDLLNTETAARLGLRIVSVDYRLAPEHPFPAPLDDCAAVWHALAERLGAQARIAVGGQSAGGGLAAGLAQRIHDEGGLQPIAQWLFCPMLDDRTAADRSRDADENFVWDNRSNRLGWTALLGHEPGTADAPAYAVPARRSDLGGLPPAWIGVGDIDLFCAEDLDYAERLARAGVAVTTEVAAGAPHAFEVVVPDAPMSRAYRRQAQDWLAAVVAAR